MSETITYKGSPVKLEFEGNILYALSEDHNIKKPIDKIDMGKPNSEGELKIEFVPVDSEIK